VIVALVAATGAIGNTVAASLHQQGRPYPVIGRSEGTLEKTFGSDPRAEVAVWDVRPVEGHEFGLKLSSEDKAALIAFLKTL
jgi:NADP-dependent 3-hydroxy acid dehydrogenase YdfG